ncbi:MAG TPA: lipopolysaccharide heptosyltransferase II [Thermoanaerobaculia bacterium]|nr:lipopolysaccharide heptosyltransferase II [Thermoanaerobaculia bacterium]
MKTLVRATNWVGDVVMSRPALRALKAADPSGRLAVLARPWVAELYRLAEEVDDVLVDDASGRHEGSAGRARLADEVREAGFDRAVVLPTSFSTALVLARAGVPERIGYRGEGRGPLLTRAVRLDLAAGEHQVWKHLRLAEAAGASVPAAPDVSWDAPKAVLQAARNRLAEAGVAGPFVAAHVASFAHAAKRWDLARFAAVFDGLSSRGLPVVLLGSAGEKSVNAEAAAFTRTARAVDLSGTTTLPEALGVLASARLFVGNDSGLAHLASAAGTPSVVVFGPTDPDATRPWDGPRADGRPVRLALVRRRTPCAPCGWAVCPIDHACMAAVAPSDVLAAAESVLS